jgi:hypothetical protein
MTMAKFELTTNQVTDLVMILGAANECFAELAKDPKTPGVFKALMTNYSEGAEELRVMITKQYNEQMENKNG